jgi:rhodanese-related sulfurtransferase
MALGGIQQMAVSYAGDVSVLEAWGILKSDPAAVLIDVRTDAEWAYVGMPDLTELGKDVKRISWITFPAMAPNPNFISELSNTVADKNTTLLFLCRSGVRSIATSISATEAGYQNSHNVLCGFEGDKDDQAHRGYSAGWKAEGLPWTQS